MTEDEVRSRLARLVTGRTGRQVDTLELDMSLTRDIGLDSLDMVELALAVEDEFGIPLSDEQMANVRTVRDVVSHILVFVQGRSAPPASTVPSLDQPGPAPAGGPSGAMPEEPATLPHSEGHNGWGI